MPIIITQALGFCDHGKLTSWARGLDLRDLAAQRPSMAVRRVNIVDFDSPIAAQELKGVSQLPHVRVVRPGGGIAFETSGPADDLAAQVERMTR